MGGASAQASIEAMATTNSSSPASSSPSLASLEQLLPEDSFAPNLEISLGRQNWNMDHPEELSLKYLCEVSKSVGLQGESDSVVRGDGDVAEQSRMHLSSPSPSRAHGNTTTPPTGIFRSPPAWARNRAAS